jgi:hypothetical protein
MASEPLFKARLKVGKTSEPVRIQVGQGNMNNFDLVIANVGDAIQKPDDVEDLIFCLAGTLGFEEDALFLNEDEARSCVIGIKASWFADWEFPAEGGFELRISTGLSAILKKGGEVEINISTLKSSTKPGTVKLCFRTNLDPDTTQNLEITKVKPDAGAILYFSPVPPGQIKFLHDQKIKLRWRAIDLAKGKLQRDSEDLVEVAFTDAEGSYTAEAVSKETRFTLIAGPHSREIIVGVFLEGWRPEANKIFPGNALLPQPKVENTTYKAEMDDLQPYQKSGLPLQPTEIINADDVCLYGVFRYTLLEKETVLLYKTDETFSRWIPVNRSVPKGFSESPGVWLGGQIWLVGGSQVDPDLTSNLVCQFDPTTNIWTKPQPANWRARMGHAVLVFNEEIWVMGGRDSAGNTLDDIWRRDRKSSTWVPVNVADGQRPAPRCLFRPTVFNGQIWVYGGVKEPFSRTVYSDLWVYPSRSKPNAWEKLEITGTPSDKGNREPIASCLQVFEDELHLIGRFRKVAAGSAGFETWGFRLTDRDKGDWALLPHEQLINWGHDNPFSLQAVNFDDKYLMVRGLAQGDLIRTLRIYIPDTTEKD